MLDNCFHENSKIAQCRKIGGGLFGLEKNFSHCKHQKEQKVTPDNEPTNSLQSK